MKNLNLLFRPQKYCVKKFTSEALSRILTVLLRILYSIFCKRNAVNFSNIFAVLNFCFFCTCPPSCWADQACPAVFVRGEKKRIHFFSFTRRLVRRAWSSCPSVVLFTEADCFFCTCPPSCWADQDKRENNFLSFSIFK